MYFFIYLLPLYKYREEIISAKYCFISNCIRNYNLKVTKFS